MYKLRWESVWAWCVRPIFLEYKSIGMPADIVLRMNDGFVQRNIIYLNDIILTAVETMDLSIARNLPFCILWSLCM